MPRDRGDEKPRKKALAAREEPEEIEELFESVEREENRPRKTSRPGPPKFKHNPPDRYIWRTGKLLHYLNKNPG